MTHNIAAAKKSSMPKWMIIAGILTVIAGWEGRNYAASHMSRALIDYDGFTIEEIISLSYLGLGAIIFGAALFLAGLVVTVLRR
jgi:hypothetical protein